MGVLVLEAAVGLMPEVGREALTLDSDNGGRAREADEGEEVDAVGAGFEVTDESLDASLVRPGGGGLSLQSCPSSGEGTKPPEGLG